MKKYSSLLLVILLFFSACEISDLVSEPEADFTSDKTQIVQGESIQFLDASMNGPTDWTWTFQGGDPTFSEEENPIVTYNTPGEYSVSMTVTNSAGTDTEQKMNYITVLPKTVNLVFQNNLYTDFQVTVDGVTETMPAGGELAFTVNANSTVEYYAETYGATNEGESIGEVISWSYSIEVGEEDLVRILDVGTDYYFLYITNTGSDLYDLYVNYELTEQTYDDVVVPADGVKYQIGYYLALTNGNVRMSFFDDSGDWVQWDHGSEFQFPFEINQKVELLNDIAKKTSPSDANTMAKKSNKTKLQPMEDITMMKLSPNGKADYPNKK